MVEISFLVASFMKAEYIKHMLYGRHFVVVVLEVLSYLLWSKFKSSAFFNFSKVIEYVQYISRGKK